MRVVAVNGVAVSSKSEVGAIIKGASGPALVLTVDTSALVPTAQAQGAPPTSPGLAKAKAEAEAEEAAAAAAVAAAATDTFVDDFADEEEVVLDQQSGVLGLLRLEEQAEEAKMAALVEQRNTLINVRTRTCQTSSPASVPELSCTICIGCS